MPNYVARITVLERHPDGSSRKFTSTRIIDEKTTVGELYDWRTRKVHDPLNGEFAAQEIVVTPDDTDD
jgi:hypothetical protein